MKTWHSRLCAALALLVLGGGALPPEAVAADRDPVLARVFEVRHRPLNEAYELVSSLLSDEGTVLLRPQLRRLVVRDRVSVLDQVGSLLESFDLPPRNVEVTLTLAMGKHQQEAGRQSRPESFSRDVRGVTETLGDFTKWTSYEQLGSRSVTGSEGSTVTARLSDEFQVVFDIASVDESRGKINLRNCTLQRLSHAADGTLRTESLHTSTVALTAGKILVLGAAKNPDAKQALFLILQAKPR